MIYGYVMSNGEKGSSRRTFLKLLAFFSAVLSLLPFSPVLNYLIPKVTARIEKRKVGNVDELIPNSYKIFFYPGDKDPFHTNLLIRNQNGEYTALNRVCVHLQCLVRYVPERGRVECPCHGSLYRPADGVPIGGPALQIGRGLPVVKLEIDEKGDIYATDMDGVISYGREYKMTHPPGHGKRVVY